MNVNSDLYDELIPILERQNRILFKKNGNFLKELKELVDKTSHARLVLWSLELAEEVKNQLMVKYSFEVALANCLKMARRWSEGEEKMILAKRAIIDCHAVAKLINDQTDIALIHALGQGCSVVHTRTHALGLPMYELSSLFYRHGYPDAADYIYSKRQHYIDRLHYWRSASIDDYTFANFIKKDDIN